MWTQVQIALAAWLPVYFAPAYRQMELRAIDEKIRRRAQALHEKMQRERVNALRGAIGLHHLKHLGAAVGGRRMRSRVPLPKAAVTASWQRPSSESPANNSATESTTTPS